MVMVTSVSRVPSSSLRSRSVVVGADQTTSRLLTQGRICDCCCAVRGFGCLGFAAGQFGLGRWPGRSAPSPTRFPDPAPPAGSRRRRPGSGVRPWSRRSGPVATCRRYCSRALSWPSDSSPGRGQARGRGVTGQRGQERLGHRGVDAHAADPQVPQLLAVDEVAGAGAVVARGVVVPPVVVDGQFAAADPARARPCSNAQPSRTAPVPGWWATGRMFRPIRSWLARNVAQSRKPW